MTEPRATRSLLEVCIARGGLLRGALVAEFVIEWTIAAADLGHQPSVNEFAHWWRDRSERTTWRRLAAFKQVFPEFDNPAPIAEQLLAEHGRVELKITTAQVVVA